MRIPLGNFAESKGPNPVQTSQAPGGQDPTGRAIERLGQTGTAIAENAYAIQQRESAQKAAELKRKQDAMARADAAHGQLKYEFAAKEVTSDIVQRIHRGELPSSKAESAYKTEIGKIPEPQPGNLSPDLLLRFNDGLRKTAENGLFTIKGAVSDAQDAHFKSQFAGVIDTLGKLAGMPGADIPAINKKAEAFAPLAREAGLDDAQIQKTLQKFKDSNWTAQATQRIDASQNDLGALEQIKHDLSAKDGYYAGRLDKAKRTALLGQIANRQDMLASRQQHAQDRADAAGQRAIGQIDKQIASGVPATPQMWTHWAETVNGTSSQKDFKERVAQAQLVQQVMSMSPENQQTYLQKMQAKLHSQGGSVQEVANMKRLKTAIDANVKQLHTDPLLYNQAHMGDAIKPLDLEQLASPDAAQTLAANLNHRAATIDAMRKQYGPSIPNKLLLPQEADTLASVLKKATPTDQVRLMHMVSGSINDKGVYQSVMHQIAPKDPVLAYAGLLAERERTMVTATHWGSSNDEHVDSAHVAMTMLQGQQILTGKDKTSIPPKETDFRSAFTHATGDLFRGRPDAAAVAMQSVRAYYVGAASEEGDTSGDLDDDRLSKAILATLGHPADVNGNGEVLPPWGMDADTFEAQAEQAFNDAGKRAGLPPQALDRWSDYGLKQASGNTYYVTMGNSFLTGKDKRPLMITVGAGASPPEHQKMTMAVDNPKGIVKSGNIDLAHRPVVHNSDGSYSTVRSITITSGRQAILIPTVVGDRVVSNAEAIRHYKKTGENLGIFADESSANAYAQMLHEQQARMYQP